MVREENFSIKILELMEGYDRLFSNPSSCARHTVRTLNPKHWNLEQRKVYCMNHARRMGGLCSKTQTPR